MDRRSFIIGTTASATALAAGPAFAQETYPSHAVTVINAFPPGGANDSVTRPIAAALEPILKQPVVIETKAGAAGQVGAQVAASAKPDGYTLLSHNNGISGYAEVDKLFGRQPKTTRADFIPLARLMADPVLLLVNDQQPYKTLKDFVDDAKKRPDAIIYSSGGLYGATHLPVALFENAVGGLKLRHLPTNGGGPAITAILGNNAQASVQSVSATLSHIKAGKLRPLASFGGNRTRVLPDVPTLKELGYNVEYYLWVGLFAPKGTPPNAVAILDAAIDKAAHSDLFKTAITNLGQDLSYLNAADFAKFWDADAKGVDEAVKSIGRQG
jgi:tripartite-type tricarboxylate transporter receptor subunit TctC